MEGVTKAEVENIVNERVRIATADLVSRPYCEKCQKDEGDKMSEMSNRINEVKGWLMSIFYLGILQTCAVIAYLVDKVLFPGH